MWMPPACPPQMGTYLINGVHICQFGLTKDKHTYMHVCMHL